MTISIITGTIINAIDMHGDLLKLYNKNLFYQYFLTSNGWIRQKSKIISDLRLSPKFNIIQTTGSGKTIAGIIHLWKAKKHGMNVKANMKITFGNGQIKSLDDLEKCYNTDILLDDIRHIITSWNSKDSKVASEFSNSSRKKGDYVHITSQRLENFVPPDIRMIADEIFVPYIRCFDTLHTAPDGRYTPLDIWLFRFTPGYEYMDCEHYNLNSKLGKYLLNSYNTLEISNSIK